MIDPTLLKAFITMAAAVGGLSLLLLLLKKKARNRIVNADSSLQTLSIESRIAVAPKSQVVVINYGDKKYILGITEQSINLIADVTEKLPHPRVENSPTFSSDYNAHASDTSSNDVSFAAFLKSITKRDFNKN
ncbi:MAG: flagellar biosynthetic protein FliO [Candidatus Kapabacteria bacterium]|jgi:flagellar biogenesis protein FliO|nr:flagellar biosynthetic protein FliO [Candidatus Kapabacteria bacterium]